MVYQFTIKSILRFLYQDLDSIILLEVFSLHQLIQGTPGNARSLSQYRWKQKHLSFPLQVVFFPERIDVSLIFVGSKPTFRDRECCTENNTWVGLPDLHLFAKKSPSKSSVFNTWSMRR